MPTIIQATTPTPCECCGGGDCTIQCRSKSGEAELCGFSEYTDASVPPKKYRRKALSGSFQGHIFFGTTDCTGATSECTNADTYSGAIQYDSADCSVTDTGTRTRSGDCEESSVNPASSVSAFAAGGDTEVLAPTIRSIANDGACRALDATQSFRRPSSPTAQEELLDPDTETDAINRELADIPDWSGPVGCDTVASFKSPRGAGQFHFTFTRVQVRAKINNPAPGAFYEVTIHYVERPLSVGGPWVDFGRQDVVQVQADLDPETEEWTDWIDVPLVEGLEIQASGCEVEVL